jgi:hypothetical protein
MSAREAQSEGSVILLDNFVDCGSKSHARIRMRDPLEMA